MNTIVMNTLGGAVSEYEDFDFQSLTPTRAGSTLGLYSLEGNLDVIAPIVATIETGLTDQSDQHKKRQREAFVSVRGATTGEFSVVTSTATYKYALISRSTGVLRATTGRGIRESYLGYKYRNTGGRAFTLDRIEIPTEKSQNRRT